jgi:tRNA pseudouridine55 synthase
MNGWININKPPCISSMGVTSRIKKILGVKKIGHAGTLDVLASGILPIAIGEATKLIDYNVDQKKEYEFIIQFGKSTSTGDAEGEVISETNNLPSFVDVNSICEKFIGEIEQTPSAYSAIKINGVPSYKLARKNIPVIIPKRKIWIYDLKLLNYDSQTKQAKYICICSKGTYIRTLAEDISLALQSLGFVIELRRTRAGGFLMSDSINFLDISENVDYAKTFLIQSLQFVSCILDDILVIDIDEFLERKVRCGQEVILDHIKVDNELVWLRYKGSIVAIGNLCGNYFRSKRVFNL